MKKHILAIVTLLIICITSISFNIYFTIQLLLKTPLFYGHGYIHGWINDANSSKPLDSVSVAVIVGDFRDVLYTVTDKKGFYHLSFGYFESDYKVVVWASKNSYVTVKPETGYYKFNDITNMITEFHANLNFSMICL